MKTCNKCRKSRSDGAAKPRKSNKKIEAVEAEDQTSPEPVCNSEQVQLDDDEPLDMTKLKKKRAPRKKKEKAVEPPPFVEEPEL